jgi:hypothetical protein
VPGRIVTHSRLEQSSPGVLQAERLVSGNHLRRPSTRATTIGSAMTDRTQKAATEPPSPQESLPELDWDALVSRLEKMLDDMEDA